MIYSFQNASFRDQQTGLYSEAYFMEIFYREWHRLIRENNALSLMVIHPHLDLMEPDELQEFIALGQILDQSTKRTTDLVSRFNKDEFIIGVFDATPKGTTTIIERILETIEGQADNDLRHARNAFISAVNLFPNQKTDINGILQEVSCNSGDFKRNSGDPAYELKAYSVH